MDKNKKKTHSHAGHRQRLRNKALAAGINYWPEHEVMELILTYAIPQKDVNPLAHDLIECFGSLAGVLDAGTEELSKINGIAEHAATYLTLLPKIYEYYQNSKNKGEVILANIHQSVKYFKTISKVNDVEDFYVFCLDNKNKLLKTVHINGIKAASIDISLNDFVNSIIVKDCKSIVIMHTHPGGNPNPTNADVLATKRLVDAAFAVGIGVDDHIIVSEDSYYSLSTNHLLDSIKDSVRKQKLANIQYAFIAQGTQGDNQ